MNKRLLIPPLLLALLGTGAFWYWSNRQGGSPDDRLQLYGNIDLRLINLAFEASGRIAQMQVSEGAQVKAGDELARLDEIPQVDESSRLACQIVMTEELDGLEIELRADSQFPPPAKAA